MEAGQEVNQKSSVLDIDSVLVEILENLNVFSVHNLYFACGKSVKERIKLFLRRISSGKSRYIEDIRQNGYCLAVGAPTHWLFTCPSPSHITVLELSIPLQSETDSCLFSRLLSTLGNKFVEGFFVDLEVLRIHVFQPDPNQAIGRYVPRVFIYYITY